MDDILAIGINHRFAVVEVRERLAFSPEQVHKALRELNHKCPGSEFVILSTCNRSEVYIHSQDICLAEQTVRSYLAQRSNLEPCSLESLLYRFSGLDAVRHLCVVSAGLDSLVVGENEILGQVKSAYEIAQREKAAGPVLSSAFRYAIRAGKRARSETEIGKNRLSIASIVVDLAEETFGTLGERTALLIGAGKISSLTGKALVRAGLRCVLVANRTYDRAVRLVQTLGESKASAIHFGQLDEYLEVADIVICSTGAPHIVLHKEQVSQAMSRRPEKNLLIADLSIPRDADPEIIEIPNTMLCDLDDLQRLVETRHPLAAQTLKEAERILDQEVVEFCSWLLAYHQSPVIRSLRAKADAILQAELERTLRRLGDLTPDQKQAVEIMGQTIINKLLHEPLICLRKPPLESSADETSEWVQTIFGLSSYDRNADEEQIRLLLN